jgi:hypothetical protein
MREPAAVAVGGSIVSVAVKSFLRGRHDHYALCPQDRQWFPPLYTEGKCPLCGEATPGEEESLPLLLRVDRFDLGLAALAVSSLAMVVLVLFMYFRA